ncbi:MAG: AbrB family transcriptional regulator [Nitrosomonadales bacterium]|nr:MAG: AbrB family transcriptional regulator [Nitrosomonadales bacterium]
MSMVTVSSRFQIVIPADVRAKMHVKAGQKFQVIAHDGHIELIPLEPVENYYGFLKGIDTTVEREREDRV